MADARVCCGPKRVPQKRPCENSTASVRRRGRPPSRKRSRIGAGVESQRGEAISCDAAGFVKLEVDPSMKVKNHRNRKSIKSLENLTFEKPQNACNPKGPGKFTSGKRTNPTIPESVESENPKGPENLESKNPKNSENFVSVNSKISECLRYSRSKYRPNRESLKYRNHKHDIEAEAEAIKAEGSSGVTGCESVSPEVNFTLENNSLNPGRRIVQISAYKGTADKNKGQALPLKSRGRKRVSRGIDDFESENNCTDELSVVLGLEEGSLANNCKITSVVCKDGKSVVQSSMPCSVIGSKKIPGVSCEDPQLVVVIPILDEQKETCNMSGKKPMQLRCQDAVATLDNYLDTDIIDKYMEHIWKKLPKYKQKSCTYLDCLWFSMYLEEALSFKILKWTKAKHIFSKQYVFIPIVHWGHWNLLILCHFGEDFSSEARTPCMLLLDSLKETDPNRLEPLIRKFLMNVHKEDGRQDGDKIIAKIPLLVPEVPQQTNGNDCGVFLLHFVDLFLKRAPENFSISEGCYPYFLNKNWFKSHAIRKRRKQIYDVLLKDQHCVNQMAKRRISTRSKKLHGFLNRNHASKCIDLSSAA